MLTVSKRTRHAILMLSAIAQKTENTTTKEMAAYAKISQSYVEQIIAVLKRSGFVGVERGPSGGYFLSRPADQINIVDVSNAVSKSCAEDPVSAAISSPASLAVTLQDVLAKSA